MMYVYVCICIYISKACKQSQSRKCSSVKLARLLYRKHKNEITFNKQDKRTIEKIVETPSRDQLKFNIMGKNKPCQQAPQKWWPQAAALIILGGYVSKHIPQVSYHEISQDQ